MTGRAAALVAVALLVPGAATATAPTRSLTGNYTAAESGNTIELTQTESKIEWVERAGSGAWTHDFDGTLSGDKISGRFQDRPGGVHNSGSITAKVLDNCRFQMMSLHIDNGPSYDEPGEIFRRDGQCVAHEPRVTLSGPKRFHARGSNLHGSALAKIVLSGRFKADTDGEIARDRRTHGTMTLDLRYSGGSDRWRVSLHGPGNFIVRKQALLVKLVAEVESTTNAALRRECRQDRYGTMTLALYRERGTMFVEVKGLCRQSFEADVTGAIVDDDS